MDWSEERFIKVYTRDTTNWLSLSWQARGLFVLILRKLNRAGVLDLGRLGAKGVAVHVEGSAAAWPSIEPYLTELLDDGCVAIEGATLRVPNFVEAQAATQSPAARKRAERERAEVTKRDSESQNVTGSHAESHAVTGGHAASRAVTTRLDETRSDETRGERAPAPEAPPAPKSPTPDGTLSGRDAFDALADAARADADFIGQAYELSALRMLGAARLTRPEIRAMAEALKAPAAWWPKGTREGPPSRVTLKRLAGFPSKSESGGYECGPLSDLIAHVRAEAAARTQREADERAAAEAAALRAPRPEERPQITPEAQARIDAARARVKAALWAHGDPPLAGAKQ